MSQEEFEDYAEDPSESSPYGQSPAGESLFETRLQAAETELEQHFTVWEPDSENWVKFHEVANEFLRGVFETCKIREPETEEAYGTFYEAAAQVLEDENVSFDQLLVITTLWWEGAGLTLSTSESHLGTYEVPEQTESYDQTGQQSFDVLPVATEEGEQQSENDFLERTPSGNPKRKPSVGSQQTNQSRQESQRQESQRQSRQESQRQSRQDSQRQSRESQRQSRQDSQRQSRQGSQGQPKSVTSQQTPQQTPKQTPKQTPHRTPSQTPGDAQRPVDPASQQASPGKSTKQGTPVSSPRKTTSGFESNLLETISQYQTLALKYPNEKLKYLEVVETLKKEFNKYKYEKNRLIHANAARQNTKEEEKGLREVFKWYAAQHKRYGKNPTFDQVAGEREVMDLGTFLKFLKDFQVISADRREKKRRLKREEGQAIFKKEAQFQKDMYFAEFVKSLDSVANIFFNEEYDTRNPTVTLASRSIEEKRFFFYKYLRIDNPQYYQNVKKGYGKNFSLDSNDPSRIPDNDISKRYKYKNTSNKMREIEEYKLRKLQAMKEEEKARENEAYEKMLREQRRQEMLKKYDEMKKNGTIFKFEEIFGMKYTEMRGDENELNVLVEPDVSDGEEDDIFTKQYDMIK